MLLVRDSELLARFRRGERTALEKVYRTYVSPVLVVLKSGFRFKSQGRGFRFPGTRSRFDLEDRLQETFVRAFSDRARAAYDGVSPYKRYLLRIARNIVIDDFRKKERSVLQYVPVLPDMAQSSMVALADPLEGLVSSTGQPEADTSGSDIVMLLERFNASLAIREKDILRLRFRDQLDHQEIEERIGLSASQIKTSEQRIRLRLYRLMKRNGHFVGYRQDGRGRLRTLAEDREADRISRKNSTQP